MFISWQPTDIIFKSDLNTKANGKSFIKMLDERETSDFCDEVLSDSRDEMLIRPGSKLLLEEERSAM